LIVLKPVRLIGFLKPTIANEIPHPLGLSQIIAVVGISRFSNAGFYYSEGQNCEIFRGQENIFALVKTLIAKFGSSLRTFLPRNGACSDELAGGG
jgi:hypothetical protein